MLKKRKYNRSVPDLPADPLFISRCHPYSTVDYREIVEDASPSRTIAVVGRCHACMGIQNVQSCAHNIDRIKLAQALHGNGNWFLNSKVVKDLRIKPDKLHGEIAKPNVPGSSVHVPPAESLQDRDFTESQDYLGDEGAF